MSSAQTLLVVGSDPETYELLIRESASRNWTISRAADNTQAVGMFQANAYDLVVTDVSTPGSEDVALLHSIHNVRRDAKVIVMTSASIPDDIVEAMREHAFAYFCRPIDSEAFMEMIARALNLPSWQDGIEVLSASPDWIALRLKCQQLTADRLVQFLREMDMGLPPKEHEDVAQAFREMLLNAIEHGAQFDPKKRVHIECIRTSRILIYHLRDPGKGFSFDFLPHAAISNPAEAPAAHMKYRAAQNLRPGGFGILLTKSLVDELIYNEVGNEVLLIKYLRE